MQRQIQRNYIPQFFDINVILPVHAGLFGNREFQPHVTGKVFAPFLQ